MANVIHRARAPEVKQASAITMISFQASMFYFFERPSVLFAYPDTPVHAPDQIFGGGTRHFVNTFPGALMPDDDVARNQNEIFCRLKNGKKRQLQPPGNSTITCDTRFVTINLKVRWSRASRANAADRHAAVL